MPGPFIAHYRIVEKIGSGGMGDVFRADDTKLKRRVAIKLLPDELASDTDLMERFEREAHLLASLNHPKIASIYDLVEAEGTRALILELVEGPTLAEHIEAATGRLGLPLGEALAIALQIAEGLEAAHERGIVHRDLKPENVKLTAEGHIKILDFGLGKVLAPEGSDSSSSASSDLVTMKRATTKGMILGTAPYMSPEQARGKSVDKRADIWSFGVVLYEMLTGVRMFEGETMTDVLAAVLTRETDWSVLSRSIPPPLTRLLKRCLERDPKKRLRDIGEARVVIEGLLTETAAGKYAEVADFEKPSRLRFASWLGVSCVVGILAFLAGSVWRSELRDEGSTVRARVVFSDDQPLAMGMRPSLALSPDGSQLVVVTEQNGVSQLYRRYLAEETAVPIRGTEQGSGPFFSPDGRFIGFFAEGKLKKVSSEGGTPVVIADAPVGQGGSFTPDGSIVFNPVHGEGLLRISPDGRELEALTSVDHAAGEGGHHWPHVLPDGQHVLMTVEMTGKPYSEARIAVVSLETKKQAVLIEGGTDARYVPTGHLVYWNGGDLWAAAFDLRKLEVRSAPFPLLRGVMAGEPNGFAQYSFSAESTFVYLPGPHPQEERSLTLFDRTGVGQALTPQQRIFENPRISPDGRRLAVNVSAANDSLWIYEFDRRTLARMTFEDENRRAVWSPAGDRLAFTSHPGGSTYAIQIASVDGSSPPEAVRESDRPEHPESWSASDVLAFTRLETGTGSDIWVLPLEGDRTPRPFLDSRFEEGEARFSYDGRWLAYQSDESGRPEIYLRAFPGPGGKRKVSVDGGTQPRWRKDGRELYFRQGNTVMVVDVAEGTTLDVSVPRALVEIQVPSRGLELSGWDALPDGGSFVFIEESGEPRLSVHLVMGWFAELRKLDEQARR